MSKLHKLLRFIVEDSNMSVSISSDLTYLCRINFFACFQGASVHRNLVDAFLAQFSPFGRFSFS